LTAENLSDYRAHLQPLALQTAVYLPERGGIDEIHMALHQFGERVLGICFGKPMEQF
jgi:hypothetical protein